MQAAMLQFHELTIGPSKVLQGILIIGYGLPLCAMSYGSDLSWWVKALLVLFILGSAWYQLCLHARLTHKRSITGLRKTSEGWQCYVVHQGWCAAQLYPGSLCWFGFIVLCFRINNRRQYVYLMLDSSPPNTLRTLRIWLRMA